MKLLTLRKNKKKTYKGLGGKKKVAHKKTNQQITGIIL